MRLLGYLLLLPFATGQSQSQSARQALSGARSLKCTFPQTSSLDWKRDDARPQLARQDFSLHIDAIDRQEQTARLIGNVGAGDLMVFVSPGVLHFFEVTRWGNLNLTSVFAEQLQTGEFKAVHSRHVALTGTPLPSQAYGSCRLWQ